MWWWLIHHAGTPPTTGPETTDSWADLLREAKVPIEQDDVRVGAPPSPPAPRASLYD